MDNISTTLTDMTSQIGALELGDNLESHSDGALEAAGANSAQPTGLGCKTQPAICGY
jgi:hypothetical protein